MRIVSAFAMLVAAAPGVPTPHGYPEEGRDFIGGPFEGLMAELRGEKTKPAPAELSAAIDELFEVGEGRGAHDLASLVVDPAIQSFESSTYPQASWSGKIGPGFLAKYKGCVHTAPWFDGGNGDIQKVHFYWSCDKQNPYILRTDIRFSHGKVESWKATEIPHPLIVNSDKEGRN